MLPIEKADILSSALGADRAAALGDLAKRCDAILAEKPQSPERSALLNATAEAHGLSTKTLYRRLEAYQRNGIEGLLTAGERRVLKQASGRGKIAYNNSFILYWQQLLAQYQRAAKPAFRALLNALQRGDVIPGLGDWRTLYAAEHSGAPVPSSCPYTADCLPKGLSYRNLMKHQPDAWALAALRVGTLSASNYLPMVQRTRAGLKRGQIIEIDDMWHDVKVRYGNALAERCIELAMLDVATGYRTYLLKPIRRREDGSRETIQKRMLPYLLGYWLVVQGYRAEGATICGEHATAKVDKRLADVLERLTEGAVRFAAGGLLSKPLAEGLWEGLPRGNFRFKARLEQSHRSLHDALSNVPGQVGYRHENTPEALYGMDKTERRLQRAVEKVQASCPGLAERLRWPFLQYADYCAIVAEVVAQINGRTDHALEGWEEQGFVVGQWRTASNEPWRDLAELDAMPLPVAQAWRACIQTRAECFSTRKMSPEEAFAVRRGEVTVLGRYAMPMILGDDLMMRTKCGDRLELRVVDKAIDFAAVVCGIVKDAQGNERLLRRGSEYGVWINPLESNVAYVAELTPSGAARYLGTAPVLAPGRQDDIESIGAQLGIRAKVAALEQAKVAPLLAPQVQAQRADAAWNEALIAEAEGRMNVLTEEDTAPIESLEAWEALTPPVTTENAAEDAALNVNLEDFLN